MVDPSSALVQGLFTPRRQQLIQVRQWNEEREWGFTEEDFKRLGPPPSWPKEPLHAVVLVPRLKTVQQTFEALWMATFQWLPHYPHPFKDNPNYKIDPEHLHLVEGVSHVRGLEWAVVNLAANWGKQIRTSTSHKSASAEVLAAVALHSEWRWSMDGISIPFVDLAGYRMKLDEYPNHLFVPSIDANRSTARVTLGCCPESNYSPCSASPEVVSIQKNL